MNIQDYQRMSKRTQSPLPELPQEHWQKLLCALELAVNVGHLIEFLKKELLHQEYLERENQQVDMTRYTELMVDIMSASLMNRYETGDQEEALPLEEYQQTLVYMVYGMIGEAGELGEKVQETFNWGTDRAGFKKELGDTSWYLVRMADELGLNMPDIFEANIAKLQKRYPEKFTPQGSVERRDTHEQ